MEHRDSFQVKVEGIQFDSAHFATYGGECELLHGHSYQVAAEVSGTLSDDSWVLDFVELKAILRGICDELDHHMLLQCDSRVLKIESSPGGWHIVTPQGSGYELPGSDVAALPLDNTTAERLAEWFSGRVWEKLVHRGAENLLSLAVEVWEGPGQSASHRRGHLPVA